MDFRKYCNVLIPTSFAVVGWIFTIWSNFLCQSVKFEPVEDNGLPTLRFGIWNYKGAAIYSDYYGNLFATSKCNPFPDSVDFDSKWKTAQAFSVIAFLMGCLSMFIPCVVPKRMMKAAAGFFMLLTLFQGLTMIQLASDFCTNNEFVSGATKAGTQLYKDDCEIDSGFILNIIATSFYFLAGLSCGMIPADDEMDVVQEPNTPGEDKPIGEETVNNEEDHHKQQVEEA